MDFRLYLVTDRKLFADVSSLLAGIEEALKGGARAVQLREKDLGVRELLDLAHRMREATGRYGAKLFINDRVDVAMAVGADGVHLGGRSMPADGARRVVRKGMLIGVSAHDIKEAQEAEARGADFITLGPVYETPSKLPYGRPLGPQIVKQVKDRVSVPVFAIGGIKKGRVNEVLVSGAHGVALISAIFGAENIRLTTEEFMRLLK